jgi:very-short-patch-repair endonuclease
MCESHSAPRERVPSEARRVRAILPVINISRLCCHHASFLSMPRIAHELRQNATDAERRLWATLRDRRLQGHKFRRQHPIGRFIVDFACTKRRLVIEADGGQHNESTADVRRTAWLESQGWRVIRFWNNDILANTEGVLCAILEALQDR